MNTPIHPTHISFVPRIVSAAHAIRSTEQVNVDMAGAHINFNSDISVYKSNLLYWFSNCIFCNVFLFQCLKEAIKKCKKLF